jgi:hypothetical protein
MEICDDELSISYPLHSDGYCPGRTPERTFDWDVTSEDGQAKGKMAAARHGESSCNGVPGDGVTGDGDASDSGDGDLNRTGRDADADADATEAGDARPLLEIGTITTISSSVQAFSSFSSFGSQ